MAITSKIPFFIAIFEAQHYNTSMNKFILFIIIALSAINNSAVAQDEICDCPNLSKKGKGSFYFAWGYNKDWYSKSDIHLKNTTGEYNPVTGKNDYYDFTIYDVEAVDRPDFKKILKTDLTIPQYVYRLGYFFNDKRDLGIEINFDHAKYVMIDNQTRHVKGNIHGRMIDKDTLVDPNFLKFEHTDGANFLMLNMMKRQRLFVTTNKKLWFSAIVKAGAGIVIPRTDITLFGQRSNNPFHVAGYVTGIETGLRIDAFKHLYLEYTGKGVFANYTNVLGVGSGKVNHHFFAFENILCLGVQFAI